MQIIVNGQRRECAPANLAELWRAETQDGEAGGDRVNEPRGYAIALNGAVVRRDVWSLTPIGDGDRIEIVRAMQGG
jgi:sulfur carrier protein